MIVAVRNGELLTLTQGKLRGGTWYVGNKFCNRAVSGHNIIPLDKLTDQDRITIVRQARAKTVRQIDFDIAKDPSLAPLRSGWIEDANRMTFDTLLD